MIVIYFNGTIVNGNVTSIGHGLYLGFLRIIYICYISLWIQPYLLQGFTIVSTRQCPPSFKLVYKPQQSIDISAIKPTVFADFTNCQGQGLTGRARAMSSSAPLSSWRPWPPTFSCTTCGRRLGHEVAMLGGMRLLRVIDKDRSSWWLQEAAEVLRPPVASTSILGADIMPSAWNMTSSQPCFDAWTSEMTLCNSSSFAPTNIGASGTSLSPGQLQLSTASWPYHSLRPTQKKQLAD